MRGFEHLLVGRQRQVEVDQFARLFLAGVEPGKECVDIRVFEVVAGLLDLVLVEHLAVGYRASAGVGPDQVENAVHLLQIHRQALGPVGDFTHHRPALQAARLLEVGELRDFHAVQPDFPTQPPRAERGRLPVVFDETDVVHARIDADGFQRAQIQLLKVVGRGLHHDLVLVVMLQPVGVFAVAPVGRPAARLNVSRVPGLGTDGAKKGRRVKSARAHFQVQRLHQHAALLRPVRLQLLNEFLKRHGCPISPPRTTAVMCRKPADSNRLV